MAAIMGLWSTALDAVHTKSMIDKNVRLSANSLHIGTGIDAKSYPLHSRNVHVVAFGKAVIGMVSAIEPILGSYLTTGIASIPTGMMDSLRQYSRTDLLPSPNSRIKIYEGANLNIPDAACLKTSVEIHDLVASLTSSDILLALISGGGSSLLTLPIAPITVQELAATNRMLSKAGASINELNTVRKQTEHLKGGGLHHLAAPADVISLILSDVVGDPLDIIASGPTVNDDSTAEEALAILHNRLGSTSNVPASVISVLEKNDKAQWLKNLSVSMDPFNLIVGSNKIAVNAASEYGEAQGISTFILTTEMIGDATEVGVNFANIASRLLKGDSDPLHGLFPDTKFDSGLNSSLLAAFTASRQNGHPFCILCAGETTVNVQGSGRGGRNQEMCLSAAIEMNSIGLPAGVTFASIGTDGQDGPTDAAGAVVNSLTAEHGLDVKAYLQNNDSYSYFTAIDNGNCLIKTGLTGTNVMDIQLMYFP